MASPARDASGSESDGEEFHRGGCLCGAVRYETEGDPTRTSVCHCADCQKRTGSAFSVAVFFPPDAVTLTGPSKTHRHTAASGRWLETTFCTECGSPVAMRAQRYPGIAVMGGTFDDGQWFEVNRHVWTGSKMPWVVLPEGCEVRVGY
ncbi:Mss4-like protein [Hyaloraphidium curvatum]|nr:Mss4-like protein [Hyaloraphidium curvatum]